MKPWSIAVLTLALAVSFLLTRTVSRAETTVTLSLDECFRRAMSDNLGFTSSRLGLRYDELEVENAKSAFDPTVSFDVSRDESGKPNYLNYIPVDIITQEHSAASLSLGQSVFTGGKWGIGAYSDLTESNVESAKNYSSYIGLSLDQPLLRGRGRKVAHSSIFLARLSGDASVHTLEEKAIDLLVSVEKAYWNLVSVRETLAAKGMALAQAESLLVYNERGHDLGVLVESDVLEAKSAFLTRKQELLEQRNQIRVAEDNLKLLLNLSAQEKEDIRVIPTDVPSKPEIDQDAESAFATALRSRPDYLLALAGIEQYEIRRGVAQNALLPSMDLSLSYRLSGSGTSFDKNFSRMGEGDAYGWTVGLNLSYPLSNRSARAEYERREIELKRGQLDLAALREQIDTEIRSGIRTAVTNRERIEVARLVVEVNELKLRKEEEKFRNHLSTSYLVLQYQTDLAESRSRYSQAIMDYMLSVANLRKAKGTVLHDADIRIVPLEQ